LLSLTLVERFFFGMRARPGQAPGIFIKRYFSIEQYQPAKRLQLDSRISALPGAAAVLEVEGVHIAYQQTLWRSVANAGLGRKLPAGCKFRRRTSGTF
jgi:hypothetical protein